MSSAPLSTCASILALLDEEGDGSAELHAHALEALFADNRVDQFWAEIADKIGIIEGNLQSTFTLSLSLS